MCVGDGVPDVPLCPGHQPDYPGLRGHEPRVDRQRVAALPRTLPVQDNLHGVSRRCKVPNTSVLLAVLRIRPSKNPDPTSDLREN